MQAATGRDTQLAVALYEQHLHLTTELLIARQPTDDDCALHYKIVAAQPQRASSNSPAAPIPPPTHIDTTAN